MAPKRSKSAASVVDLPDEIVEKILLRLPASCTFRFRAVCRSWAALLTSPGFADAYAVEAGARSSASTYLVFAPSPASPGGATAVYSCRQGGGEGAEICSSPSTACAPAPCSFPANRATASCC
jgi:hypothetical protein